MKRRIVSLLLAVIMLFGLLPVTALAEVDAGSSGIYHTYRLDGLEYDGISVRYTIYAEGAANYKIDWTLYTRDQWGKNTQQRGTDRSTHEHYAGGDHVRHSFVSSKYWFYLTKNKTVFWKTYDGDDELQQIGIGSKELTAGKSKVDVYAMPLAVPMEKSTEQYLTSVTQRSKAAVKQEARTVNVYVDGEYVGKQNGSVLFPNREDAKASDLTSVVAAPGYRKRSTDPVTVTGKDTYNIWLVTDVRTVTVKYQLIGYNRTQAKDVVTKGLSNSVIKSTIFDDSSLQNQSFTITRTMDPTETFDINVKLGTA